jgi:hypothetical protein
MCRTSEFIFYNLSIEKSHLEEVSFVMFPAGKWHWKLIFCLLDVLKSDFVQFEEAMFQDVEW